MNCQDYGTDGISQARIPTNSFSPRYAAQLRHGLCYMFLQPPEDWLEGSLNMGEDRAQNRDFLQAYPPEQNTL
jgi:hypothetical protein